MKKIILIIILSIIGLRWNNRLLRKKKKKSRKNKKIKKDDDNNTEDNNQDDVKDKDKDKDEKNIKISKNELKVISTSSLKNMIKKYVKHFNKNKNCNKNKIISYHNYIENPIQYDGFGNQNFYPLHTNLYYPNIPIINNHYYGYGYNLVRRLADTHKILAIKNEFKNNK